MGTEFTPAEVFPASDYITEELEERGWSKGDFADIIGRSPKFVSDLLTSRVGVTLDTARRLSKAFGTSAQFWINLDTAYRLHSEPESGADEAIVKRARLYSIAPINDMIRRGWLPDCRDDVEVLAKNVAQFFGAETLEEVGSCSPRLVARKGTDYCETTPEQRAWLCRAVELARSTHAAPFTASGFTRGVDRLRTLSANGEDLREVPRVLSDLGVRLVVVEHLPRTRIDGACFWLDEQSPAVALSLRYGRIDHFWYSLGHELGHVFHGDGLIPVDDNIVGSGAISFDGKPPEEQRADQFAESMLVPQDRMQSFIDRKRPIFSERSIVQFARVMGVHPGIILGQLQFRKLASYAHCRQLLVDVREAVLSSAMHDGWGHVPFLE